MKFPVGVGVCNESVVLPHILYAGLKYTVASMERIALLIPPNLCANFGESEGILQLFQNAIEK